MGFKDNNFLFCIYFFALSSKACATLEMFSSLLDTYKHSDVCPIPGPALAAATSASTETPSTDRDKRSVFSEPAVDMVDEFAAPKMFVKSEDR